MTLPTPIRFDQLQAAMVDVLSDATGAQVAWAYGQGIYTETFPGDFVNLTLASGPQFVESFARGVRVLPLASVDYTVTSIATNLLVSVYVNGVPYRHTGTALDTVDTARDALVAAVNADEGGPYTASPLVAAGAWQLVPDSFASIWSVRAVGPMSSVETLEDELALATQGRASISVTVETYSKSRSPRAGAWSMMSRIAAALALPEYALALRDYGVGIGVTTPPVDLSAIAGGAWESRVAFTVDCNLTFTVLRPIDQITTVQLDTALAEPLLTATIEASLP